MPNHFKQAISLIVLSILEIVLGFHIVTLCQINSTLWDILLNLYVFIVLLSKLYEDSWELYYDYMNGSKI